MILSADPAALPALLAFTGYLLATLSVRPQARWPDQLLALAWGCNVLMLLLGVLPSNSHGPRIGFAPVLSFTAVLVLAIYGVENRFVPLPGPRRVLGLCAAVAVALAWLFPGELPVVAYSRWAPLHWVLGLASYGLFGVAVLHAVLLDSADQRLRPGAGRSLMAFGLPLLKLERLTFRFVEAGFVVLTLALLLGMGAGHWRWDHKTVLSLLGWATFAALMGGRYWRGWRGRQATRWLYAGVILLLLAYVGSRFVLEVVLRRAAG